MIQLKFSTKFENAVKAWDIVIQPWFAVALHMWDRFVNELTTDLEITICRVESVVLALWERYSASLKISLSPCQMELITLIRVLRGKFISIKENNGIAVFVHLTILVLFHTFQGTMWKMERSKDVISFPKKALHVNSSLFLQKLEERLSEIRITGGKLSCVRDVALEDENVHVVGSRRGRVLAK